MHIPPLILDLAIILGVAAFVTFLFRRIKQPVVLGYIVAGIVVGPHTPAVFSIADNDSIRVWAELGVIFLMFTLGLEFSFRRLARVGMPAGVTALVQIIGMLVFGIITANLLDWSKMDAIFLGCMISVSSTTIIIKALDELGMKGKKFADLVFGILIVEDLAAILMMVALTNMATTSQIGGLALLVSGLKLLVVVGVWFVVGMFLIPRAVGAVSRHGTDEMLTVMAVGLCLALVALAANFNYSVALGAFVMGSILAESSEAKRIEHLVQPLKDVFGAVFFVSVGMLLDPHAILDNWGSVLLISGVIIVGKMLFVTLGALVTGQTVRTSVQTGFSMAQIGEFSFIIATLGLTYQVIDARIYPIIVAASLITTFTTPYMIKWSDAVAGFLEAKLPSKVRTNIDNYVAWTQRRLVSSGSGGPKMTKGLVKWALNGLGIFIIFTVAAGFVMPVVEEYVKPHYAARGVTWLVAFAASSPSIYAMLTSFRGAPAATLISRLITAGLVGLLSIEYFPALISLAVTLALFGAIFIFFRRQIEGYYRWIEDQFRSGFQADLDGEAKSMHDKLAPWDAHLVEIKVPGRSRLIGSTLAGLQLRERFGLNVVVIIRDGENIVAPRATECIYPGDRLLCFATDTEIEKFREEIEDQDSQAQVPLKDLGAYDLRRFKVGSTSRLNGVAIRDAGLREFDCIVVGLERRGDRTPSPKSDMKLTEGDIVWVVGQAKQLTTLSGVFH